MTAIELKKLLKQRIEEIDDEAFLNAIKIILDSKSPSRTLNLTDEQRAEIIASQKQISNGLYTDQAQMDQEFEKWLNAR
ncbi:hypothetical protein [Mangrovibacterium marinum]|uniref:Addiction module component n=1 Tax=Mangrovibacterium marinum TaxID=1639118 RepID=A0A2T5BZV3_9BACT|nr:hypothetical protein [Mangrovibacterium marinum]PTN07810.1 hypothetical protein C8N47_11376 [Mangrovibacterium marinum]